MNWKIKTAILILLVWTICVQAGEKQTVQKRGEKRRGGDELKQEGGGKKAHRIRHGNQQRGSVGKPQNAQKRKASLAHQLQTMFKDYYSSSYLWQCMSHYFNKSKLALPGFSNVFRGFSQMDRHHAQRVLELKTRHGFKFEATKHNTNVMHVVTRAFNKLKANDTDHPICTDLWTEIITNKAEMRDLEHFITAKRHIRQNAMSVLKIIQVVENCHMTLNFNEDWGNPHLDYIIQKEFATKHMYRKKYISDLMKKLKGGDGFVEFYVDKILKSTALSS